MPLSEVEQYYQKLKHLDNEIKLKLIERLKKDIEQDLLNGAIIDNLNELKNQES